MRHVVQSFATTAAIQLLGLANAVLLARLLGPEGRGELALVLLYPVLAHGLTTPRTVWMMRGRSGRSSLRRR